MTFQQDRQIHSSRWSVGQSVSPATFTKQQHSGDQICTKVVICIPRDCRRHKLHWAKWPKTICYETRKQDGNTEARSCNHCCRGKAVLHTVSVCLYPLVSRVQCACHALASVACLALRYFFHISSYTGRFSREKKKVTEQNVFWISLQILSEEVLHSKKNWGRYDKKCILVIM